MPDWLAAVAGTSSREVRDKQQGTLNSTDPFLFPGSCYGSGEFVEYLFLAVACFKPPSVV